MWRNEISEVPCGWVLVFQGLFMHLWAKKEMKIKKVKRQATEWEKKVFGKHISDKGLLSEVIQRTQTQQ